MKAQEFCYWLQGWFELANVEIIDIHQTYIIKEHLNLVFSQDVKANNFCHALHGFFQIQENNCFDAQQTYRLKQMLREIFKNEIDPSYPLEEQELLQQAHWPVSTRPRMSLNPSETSELIKC